MQKEIIDCQNLPGKDAKAGFALALNRVFSEFKIITLPNNKVSQAPPNTLETKIPTTTPSSIKMDQDLITSISVLPFLY